MNDIRIGIIGTGSFANWHAEKYAAIDGVELSACCDLSLARAAEFRDKHSFRHAVSTPREVFDACDAVSITTPEDAHAELVLAAIAAGKHVLCEKPLCITADEAREVATVVRAAPVVHMINFTKRNAPAVQEAIRLARSGALGQIRYVHASYFQSWIATRAWGHWTEPRWLWRLHKPPRGAGGALTDIGSHMLDLTSAVAGPIAHIRCTLACLPKILDGMPVTEYEGKALDANDSAIIEVVPSEGGVGLIQLTRWASGVVNEERLELFGTEGAVKLNLSESIDQIHLCRGDGLVNGVWEQVALEATPNTCQRFIDAIRDNKPAEPDLIRGAQIQYYLDSCERSAASGAWTETPIA